jgi:hypothetical protein
VSQVYGKMHKGVAKVVDPQKGLIQNLAQYATKQEKPAGAENTKTGR